MIGILAKLFLLAHFAFGPLASHSFLATLDLALVLQFHNYT